MMRNRLLTLLVAVLAALTVAGCFGGDDEDGTGRLIVGPPPVPFADTPDQAIANFATAYEARDMSIYTDHVLHAQYRFVLQQQTVEDFGLPDNLYEYEDEVALSTKLFGEQPGSSGQIITQIDVERLQPQGVWDVVGDSDQYFGDVENAMRRTYNVKIIGFVQGQNLQLIVEGNVIFYVAPVTIEWDGETHEVYRLLGNWDYTAGKATQSTTWSSLKALYR